MITVSTTSRVEARQADRALEEGLPPGTGYSVYLNGTLYSERQSSRPQAEWPPDAEARG